ncbi:hypothetical protein GWI33_014992 [Rhynchophorus ferrugineus]|uniref:Uncharacterized protein n=1 Tax=Rhynchophorus ferrugineus TaxID=354439 RepID=A0A834MBU6_RHYFE|nr:hypothetical protein GWI33_014992 [Rhynchophorus ferrugineus]
MDKKEFRVLIKYYFLNGKNTVEAKAWLDAGYKDCRYSTELKISTERVHNIIHENLDMRNLCAKWVPRELTFDQKQRRVDDSEQCLKMIRRNKPEFLRRYVTMDEIWLHHFTPKSN